jgi:hypothetical protein
MEWQVKVKPRHLEWDARAMGSDARSLFRKRRRGSSVETSVIA